MVNLAVVSETSGFPYFDIGKRKTRPMAG